MRLIGGLVAWKQPVGIPQLRAMARSVPGAGVPFYAVRGSVGLFSTLPSDRLESTSDISGVANLDLTNTEELHALTGVGEHLHSPSGTSGKGSYSSESITSVFAACTTR